ncbi:hypothetical protein HPULCUR_001866 [Helicostylum pulchrum]|uniref:Uncharacterized protein n=1 Tax=Helicostylum pulchrum TaxID=562976 RepID=A0ABP9XNW0_9FUNG
MPKKVVKKQTPEMKRMITSMRKQMNRSPKQLAKELAEGAKRRTFFDDCDTGMEDNPYQRTTGCDIWERYAIEELVDSYVASSAKGNPGLPLKNPQ